MQGGNPFSEALSACRLARCAGAAFLFTLDLF
jgi:hypothetical protein